MVCLQTLLFMNYFGKIKQLFTHLSQLTCDLPNLRVKVEGANGIYLFCPPTLSQLEYYCTTSNLRKIIFGYLSNVSNTESSE